MSCNACRARCRRRLAEHRDDQFASLSHGKLNRSVHNRSAAPARALLLSTTGLPANTYFPETGRWVLRNAPGDEQTLTS